MKYQIKTEFPQQQYIQIRAELDVVSEITILQFPAWRPGRYELGNFAKNVRSFKVFDENAKLLKFEKISKDQWRVETQGVKQVFIYYSYYAAELNAGSTFLDAKMLYVNPVNCLIYVLGRENESCTLSVDLFKEMHYSGTLPCENNAIAAKTYHELVDSPFIFCDDVESNTYQYVGVDFKISFIGIAHVPWERVIQDFQKFTKVQMDDFRGFPVKSYHFIVIATDYPHYHGVEHLASTVIVLGPSFELFTNLYDELLGVSSHELYHVWNVKSIRSVDLYPYDYSRENYSRMGYLCEGVTTYLGDYYLMISGIWSVDRYLKELTELFQKHIDNAGRFNSSLAESSFDTWLDGYVVGAPGRKVSIYNEGALFAFVTDIFMRQHTQGKISLKDAMYVFYHDYDQKNMGVSEKDFISVVEALVDQDYESLFNALVYGQGSYEGALMDALEFLELELIYSTNPDLTASRLGIQTQQERDCAKITNIAIGSAADLGGLMLGDKIWAINNKVIYGKLQSCLRNFSNQPLHLTIERKGNVICLEMPETSTDHFKRVSLQKIEIPSKLAGRIFSYWSGMKRLKPPRGGSFK